MTFLEEARIKRPDLTEKYTDVEIIAIYCPKDMRLEKEWPDYLTRAGGVKMSCKDCWQRQVRR